jgi:hypothetical protein
MWTAPALRATPALLTFLAFAPLSLYRKRKRKQSQFEVIKHFYRLRKDITDLLLRDFAMRRKLKKLAKILPEKEFVNYYNAWFKNYYKLMSKQQRENMNKLFQELREGYYV